jgi:hypothetical protein
MPAMNQLDKLTQTAAVVAGTGNLTQIKRQKS